jgi:hypothetical protein
VRALVCGSRDYSDYRRLAWTLDAVNGAHGIDFVIEGEARGADRLARRWAEERGIPFKGYPANWARGRKGGPIRNRQMLAEGKPDLVIAFPLGKLSESDGTKDMVTIARAARVRTIVVGIDDIGVRAAS